MSVRIRKKRSRTVLLLLIAAILVSSFSGVAPASADSGSFAGGSGTEADPWLLSTPEQLDRMRDAPDSYYKLKNDIDLTSYLAEGGAGYRGGKGWNTIPELRGGLDGDDHTIKGLFIRGGEQDYQLGLFGMISGRITNLGMIDVDMEGYWEMGSLAMYLYGSLSHVHVTGTVKNKSGRNTGGLVARAQPGSEISDSYSAADVSVPYQADTYVGGIAGEMNGTLRRSHSTGHIYGGRSGGLVGGLNGTIIESYSTAEAASFIAGGLTAVVFGNPGSSSVISDSYAAGIVTGELSGGGLVGWAGDYTTLSLLNSHSRSKVSGQTAGGLIGVIPIGNLTIQASSSGGTVAGSNIAGGLVGEATTNLMDNSSFNIQDNYVQGEVAGNIAGGLFGQYTSGVDTVVKNSYIAAAISGTAAKSSQVGRTFGSGRLLVERTYWNRDNMMPPGEAGAVLTSDMKRGSLYADWDFDEIWDIREGQSYPFLRKGIPSGWQVDAAPPLAQSTVIADAAKGRLTVTMDEPLADTSATDGISVLINGETASVASVHIAGRTLEIALTDAVPSEATVALSYDQDVGQLADPAGNKLASFETQMSAPAITVVFAGGNGAQSSPWLIATAEQLSGLRLLASTAGKYFRLTADIDLAGYLAAGGAGDDGGRGWAPIRSFSGTLDGAGHVVRGLTIRRDEAGLFERVTEQGAVLNLGLTDVDIASGTGAGGIAYTLAGRIEGSYVTGAISGADDVGGLAGIAVRDAAGGSASVIRASFSQAALSGDTHVGGLIGRDEAGTTVERSFSAGSVHGGSDAGGLIGRTSGARIADSYSTASVSGQTRIGGLTGSVDGGGSIRDSYAAGAVSGESLTGGLVGTADAGLTVTASRWDSGKTPGDSPYGEGTGTLEMKRRASYTGWNFEGTWTIREQVAYPQLSGIAASRQPDAAPPVLIGAEIGPTELGKLTLTFDEPVQIAGAGGIEVKSNGREIALTGVQRVSDKVWKLALQSPIWLDTRTLTVSYTAASAGIADTAGNRPPSDLTDYPAAIRLQASDYFAGGSGTEEDPYLLSDGRQLSSIRYFIDSTGIYLKLTGDIDLTEFTEDNWTGWQPIPAFNGTLDGDGHRINGLHLYQSNGGLFRTVMEQGKITRLGLTDVSASSLSATGAFTGTLSGVIEDSYVTGAIDGYSGIGAIAGSVKGHGAIRDSHSSADIIGDSNIGGLAGRLEESGTISGSYSEGKVTASVGQKNYAGGLVGNVSGSSRDAIVDSYSTAEVSGNNNIGGLAGYLNGAAVRSSYGAGKVTGSGTGIGGIAGTGSSCQIVGSRTTGQVSGGNAAGGLAGGAYSCRIEASFSSGSVAGSDAVGGLLGSGSAMTIADSYSRGAVTGQSNVGGLAGNLFSGSMNRSYSIATVSGASSVDVLTANIAAQIADSYWDRDRGGVGSSRTALGRATADLKQAATFANWDFSSVWALEEGSVYPYLRGIDRSLQPDTAPPTLRAELDASERSRITVEFDEAVTPPDAAGVTVKVDGSAYAIADVQAVDPQTWVISLASPVSFDVSAIAWSYDRAVPIADQAGNRIAAFTDMPVVDGLMTQPFFGGSGTQEDPWQIRFPRNLDHVRDYAGDPDAHFKLVADIDLTDYLAVGGAGYDEKGWTPIPSFSGSLDGAGHTVHGLWTKQYGGGLFGTLQASAVVTRLGLTGVSIAGNSEAGAIARIVLGLIDDSYATGTLQVYEWAAYSGGLAGLVKGDGQIRDSYNGVSISGIARSYCVGGVAGSLDENGTIVGSHNMAAIRGGSQIGGVAGCATGADRVAISDSYNTANLSGDTSVGGLIGFLVGTKVIRSYNTGAVQGDSQTGGLIGYAALSTIQDSYSSANVSIASRSGGGLVGSMLDSVVERSFSSGSAAGGVQIGGLVGYAARAYGIADTPRIVDSYSTATVTGDSETGGLAGSFWEGGIRNSYAAGKVNGGADTGGLVGRSGAGYYPELTAAYWNADLNTAGSIAGGTGVGGAALKREGTFAGWNFDTVWEIRSGEAYPILKGIDPARQPDTAAPFISKAEIRSDTPDLVTLFFDEPVTAADAAGMTVSVNQQTLALAEGTAAEGNAWSYTLAQPVSETDAATLSYDSAAGRIADRFGNPLGDIADLPIVFRRLNGDAAVLAQDGSYTVDETALTIVSQDALIAKVTTVEELLSHLTKNELAAWKVVAADAAIETRSQFKAAVSRSGTDRLIADDRLAVMAEDGTIRVYAIEVLPSFLVRFESGGGSPVASQSVVRSRYAVQPAAPVLPGYRFAGWYAEQGASGQPFDFAGTPIEADTTVYARWTKELSLTLSVVSVNGSVYGDVSVIGNVYGENAMGQASFAYGDAVALTAVPMAGYRFESWKDAATGKILSTLPAYGFTMTEAASLTATFAELSTDLLTVRFVSESGQILSVQQVPRGGSAIPPPTPSKPDAAFIAWSAEYTNVQTDLTLRPVYSAAAKTYRLTVNGGADLKGLGEYPFDTAVTVAADAPAAGLQFSHWELGGAIVSYSPTYTFYITGDTVIAAIYDEAPAARMPLVSISPDVLAQVSARKLSFIGQIDVPSGYKLLEYGLAVKLSAEPPEELRIGTTGVIKARSSSHTDTGQFMMNKTNVGSGETWYARAYLTYQDGEGQIVTIYSAMVAGTMP